MDNQLLIVILLILAILLICWAVWLANRIGNGTYINPRESWDKWED